jgi:hypothetical protein
MLMNFNVKRRYLDGDRADAGLPQATTGHLA